MKNEIIKILGDNHTDACVFENEMVVSAIYTFENDVFCLKDGWDFPFDELEQDEQEDILLEIKEKRYTIDDTFQG